MRANPSIEHIFSELYHVREKRKPGYMKIKMLELLLFFKRSQYSRRSFADGLLQSKSSCID